MQGLTNFMVNKQCMFIKVIVAATASDRRDDNFYICELPERQLAFLNAC
jgi:hypothetical protein